MPTLGRSPWLGACLEALRRQQGVRALEILVVDQAPRPLALPPGLADRVLRPGRNLGFAGGTNFGIAAAAGELVATVNDDAVVGPGWLAALAAALRAVPDAAAVQGVNLLVAGPGGEPPADDGQAGGERPGEPEGSDRVERVDRIDGCGLGWNRWWQAVQLGHGEPASRSPVSAPVPAAAGEGAEIFGVSATAALYRRAALDEVSTGGGRPFDAGLISYYEDAELAGRLRAAGFRALLVPAARARHAASASARAAPASRERWRLVYGNRYLAAARLLGRGLWPRLPLMLLRDLLDLLALAGGPHRGASSGDAAALAAAADRHARRAGLLAGWRRAVRLLPAYARSGPPAPPAVEVARLSRWPVQPR